MKYPAPFAGGRLAEEDGRVVGFAMGDRATGELWVIAVQPEYLKRGIGSELMRRVEAWLVENRCWELWLTTDLDPRLRAYPPIPFIPFIPVKNPRVLQVVVAGDRVQRLTGLRDGAQGGDLGLAAVGGVRAAGGKGQPGARRTRKNGS